ncbi:MAG: hypothetical protein HY913_21615 [Desulfomonile tiedjei]|nr:hypothetical protein [Desulfomonile tiedjei]
MRRLRAALVASIFFGMMASTSGANDFLGLGKGSNQPIDITAKSSIVRDTAEGKEVTFERNVRVRQGDLTLTCDKLIILYDEQKSRTAEGAPKKLPKDWQTVSGIKSITAIGKVNIAQDERSAVAGKALFDNAKRTITLTEGPRLWQGPDMLVAHTIIIYMDENRAELRSKDGKDGKEGKNGDEITVRINPGKQKKDKEK